VLDAARHEAQLREHRRLGVRVEAPLSALAIASESVNSETSCVVNAFVDATPISAPARV
jgi:hypothetical protein